MEPSTSAANPTFKDLGVKPWLIDQCKQLGITSPSPVQRNCIPKVLEVGVVGSLCIIFRPGP